MRQIIHSKVVNSGFTAAETNACAVRVSEIRGSNSLKMIEQVKCVFSNRTTIHYG